MKIARKIIVFATALVTLVGCGKGKTSSNTPEVSAPTSIPLGSDGYKDIGTVQTDSLKFTQDYEGKTFTTDGIGIATFRSHTDGDTTNWYINEGRANEEKIKFRYLGINTPESTARVEPWGVAASKFTKSKVSNAKLIVLINDEKVFGKTESNGRYLGFVWYSMSGKKEDLRLLNLELVELGYAHNQLHYDSEICNYRAAFAAAEAYAKACKIKIHGEQDLSYDYTTDVFEISIYELRTNYEKYGIVSDGDNVSSGKQLRIKALVVALIGNNLVIRDLARSEDQDEDSPLPSIYAYAGYGQALSSFVKAGDVVRFYCRATKFNDTMQLSDVYGDPDDIQKPFEVYRKYRDKTTGNPSIDLIRVDYEEATFEAYEMDTSKLSSSSGYAAFKPYEGLFVKTRVTIREITPEDNTGDDEGSNYIYYNEDANHNYTCYAYSQTPYGKNYLVLNLRVDANQSPKIHPSFFTVGHTYECVGYLSPYFDKYQLMLVNDIDDTNFQYVVDVTPGLNA